MSVVFRPDISPQTKSLALNDELSSGELEGETERYLTGLDSSGNDLSFHHLPPSLFGLTVNKCTCFSGSSVFKEVKII